jgi:hypothetical protein
LFLPTAKLAGPVKSSQTDAQSVLLESDTSYLVPVISGLLGLCFLTLSFFFLGFPGAMCALVCFSFSAEPMFRPRVFVSSHSKSIQILKWSLLRFRWCAVDQRSLADIREILAEAELDLDFGHPLIWHLVVLFEKHQRLDLTWHFQKEPTMKAATRLSELTGKPLRVETDPTRSGRWAYWGYNFLR